MKKHLILKASILLIVMFFHSFVLIPKANATAMSALSQAAARWGTAAIAPSTVGTMASAGAGLLLEVSVYGAIFYLLYNPSAITKMWNWIQGINPNGIEPPAVSPVYMHVPGHDVQILWTTNPPGASNGLGWYGLNMAGSYLYGFSNTSGAAGMESVASQLRAAYPGTWYWGTSPPSPPTVPTDYGAAGTNYATDPGFNGDDFRGTPGLAAKMLQAQASGLLPQIIQATQIPSSEASGLANTMGLTAINPATAEQTGSAPSDNTVTQGDANQTSLLGMIGGLLSQMLTYLANLVGIKTDTGHISQTQDNIVAGVGNLNSTLSSQSSKLDDIALSELNQTQLDNQMVGKLDNVAEGINTLDCTMKTFSSTQSGVQTRMDALKTLALTKFPFSMANALSVSTVSGSSTYSFASLPLTSTISIPIDPLAGPLHDFFVWVRSILVWLLWAGTLFAMLKKVMEF